MTTLTVYPCPQCTTPMHAVRVTSHYGKSYEVEQCASCGGMWFDWSEHHRLSEHEVATLDPLDVGALAHKCSIPETLTCPKDGSTLHCFQDSMFPRHIVVETCSTCGGIWFNKGEFLAYREYFNAQLPRTKSEGVHTQLIAHAFLEMNDAHTKRARQRRISRTVSIESLKSLIAFLLTKSGNAVVGAVPIAPFIAVLGAFFAATMNTSEEGRVYVDTALMKELITEVQRNMGTRHL